MARLTITRHVNASPDRTFGVFTDLRGAPDRIPEIVSLEVLTEGDIGVGTRFRETRKMFGKDETVEMEITSFTPGSSYAVECESCGAHYGTTFQFTPSAQGGTDVEMDLRVRPISFFAKLMSPVAGFMMGTMKKALDKDMDRLQAAVEAG